MEDRFCPQCGQAVPAEAFFCPHCGMQLAEAPFAMSLIAQVGIYALSFFLPPLGLWPGIKYARRADAKAKQVGWIAIILTVISTVISIWLIDQFLNVYLNTITQLNGL
jgi:hypothetical protein